MGSGEKLRILFITGGTHKRHMRNLNHFQRVYFLSRWSELSILGVKNSDFTLSADAGTKIYRSIFRNKAASLVYFFAWILIRGRRCGFDLVITEPSLYSVCGFWARMTLRAKWVVDVWDIPIRNQSDRFLMRLKTRFERRILKILFRRADLFIVSILPEYELQYFKLPSAKLLLLKNAIWLDDISKKEYVPSSDGSFEILYMRSVYTVYSGLDILAQAYHSICEDLDVSLTVIGMIPAKIKPHLDVLVGRPGIHFFDFIEHDRLLEMIRNASVCIIPYKNVPDLAQIYPVKLLEYMALGRAVIAPDMGGFARMIRDGWNGLLFKPGDASDLALQIRTLYSDSELRNRIAQNARQTISKEYDCEEKNRLILSRLESLVEA